MITNHLNEVVFDHDDLFNLQMQGVNLQDLTQVVCDDSVDIDVLQKITNQALQGWRRPSDQDLDEFDRVNQHTWFMPDTYKHMDIASYVLDLCSSPEQLQRVGQELLLFQERDLMDVLRYMKYLTDTMRQNHLIWGVGRGSSVASYVLYLLGVHRIDSMYYDLDPREFLR